MAEKLTARCVQKIFHTEKGETRAIEEISLGIREGEFLCILGPSGCGKTTLLNMFAGFELPSSGSVLLDGREITGPGPDRGVVFQEHALFPWLTVSGNIASGKRVARLPRSEQQRTVEKYTQLVRLAGFESHYPHQLSGGMKQRVALARVLANEPEVLLMDEPFAALDAITRGSLQSELIDIRQKTGKTIVFVTHNIEEAVVLGDRIAVMSARPGRIKEILDVPLAKPLDINSIEFNDIERRVRELLLPETTALQY